MIIFWRLKYYSEMVVFEDWIEKSFSKANQELESAINLAELYWQGLDPDLIKRLI